MCFVKSGLSPEVSWGAVACTARGVEPPEGAQELSMNLPAKSSAFL